MQRSAIEWEGMNDRNFIVAADSNADNIDREVEGIAGSRENCHANTEEDEVEVVETVVGFVVADFPVEADREKMLKS